MDKLIKYLLEQDERKLTWKELALKFDIEGVSINDKAKNAKQLWDNFLSSLQDKNLKLQIVKQKYKEGELVWETKQVTDISVPDTEGMSIKKITKGPYGSWTTYTNDAKYGLNEDQVKELRDKFSLTPFYSQAITEGSGIGVVDVSDIHSGALVKIFSEVVKKKEFNIEILINYLDQIAEIVNEKKFKEVHLFIPGDIIESFSGFNHKDTYKNIEAHQGQIVIIAYEVLKRLIGNINNCTNVYLVEGNHDRWTSNKEGNARKGIVEVVSHFLSETSNVKINYHPFLISAEIDNIFHICTHGDWKPWKKGYDSFFFRYGKQGMFNVLKTGHFHRFNILEQNPEYLHYECPSVFTGGLFEEFLGFGTIPSFTILENFNDICSIEYKPLKFKYDRGNKK